MPRRLIDLSHDVVHGMTTYPGLALVAITELKGAISEREREAVSVALEDHTWREVGEALNVSKQAAFQRFGKEWAISTKAKLPKAAWKQNIKQRLSG